MKNKYKLILGAILITISILLSVLLKQTNPYFSIVLFSFGVATLTFIIPGLFNLKYKTILSASGSLGVFVFLLLYLKPSPPPAPAKDDGHPSPEHQQVTVDSSEKKPASGDHIEMEGEHNTVVTNPDHSTINIIQNDSN